MTNRSSRKLNARQSNNTLSPKRDFIRKYALLILTGLTLIVYSRVVFQGFTELDDKFFVVQNESFNKSLENIPVAFGRGLFGPANDLYYRPLFLVDMILEYQVFGTSPWGYHLTSLIFHILAVCLLFTFFRKIRIPDTDALILSALFAVHPVLTQAVAWIPGRNDMLLMIFFLAAMIGCIQYYDAGIAKEKWKKWKWFIAQFIFLLMALFIKETAVVIPVITILVLVFLMKVKPVRTIPLLLSSIFAILIWFFTRSAATLLNEPIPISKLVTTGFSRIPAMIQYLGKIFFPFNLSVYPLMEDTGMIWGILALILFTGLIIWSKSYSRPLTLIGLFWFLIFLAPVLVVPKSLNDQVFEHRLYIPVAGILMMLDQTILFSGKWKEQKKWIITSCIILLFGAVSFSRIGYFRDSDTFWRKAIIDSPHAIMPKMMRVNGQITPGDRDQILKDCYGLDQDQMMVSYTIGVIRMQEEQFDSAKVRFYRELKYSQFPDIYYRLAQIYGKTSQTDSAVYCLEKVVDLDPGHPSAKVIREKIIELKTGLYLDQARSAIEHNELGKAVPALEAVIRLDPLHPEANHNLAMLYFQMGLKDKALEVINQMKLKGLTMSPDLVNLSER